MILDPPSEREEEYTDGPKGVPRFGKTLGELRVRYLGMTQAELSAELPWKLNGKQVINYFENKGRGSFEKAWDVLEYLYKKGFNLHHFFSPETEEPRRELNAEVLLYYKTLETRHAELLEELEVLENDMLKSASDRLQAFREKALRIYEPILLEEDESLPLDSGEATGGTQPLS